MQRKIIAIGKRIKGLGYGVLTSFENIKMGNANCNDVSLLISTIT